MAFRYCEQRKARPRTASDNLQRVREFSIRSANGTATSVTDQLVLQSEGKQLISKINRIGSGSRLNGVQYLAQNNTSLGEVNLHATGTSIAAQTNSMPQVVLALLRGQIRSARTKKPLKFQ